MRFSMSGRIQYFTWLCSLRAAMHQGHARPVPPQIQGGDGRRILAANHHHIHVEIGMRLAVVVENFGKIFAGNIQLVGQIVVAGGNDQLAGAVVVDACPGCRWR